MYAKAIFLFEEAWEDRKYKPVGKHPDILETTNDLAVLYTKKSEYYKVELLLLDASKGHHLKIGDTHPHTLESWHNLIALYEAWNKPEKANVWRAKRVQIEDLKSNRTQSKSPL